MMMMMMMMIYYDEEEMCPESPSLLDEKAIGST